MYDDMWRSPNHGTNNGRASEPQAVPPCKPPPSRPPVTPSIDEVSSGFHGVGSNNVNNSNNNNSGTPTNVPNSNSSHNLATPTARQTKSVRISFPIRYYSTRISLLALLEISYFISKSRPAFRSVTPTKFHTHTRRILWNNKPTTIHRSSMYIFRNLIVSFRFAKVQRPLHELFHRYVNSTWKQTTTTN